MRWIETRAESFANGREALDYLAAHDISDRPCVILLDLMMPVLDGWQTSAALASDPNLSALPVVIITAGGRSVRQPIGARSLLHKPLEITTLLETVDQYCGCAGSEATAS